MRSAYVAAFSGDTARKVIKRPLQKWRVECKHWSRSTFQGCVHGRVLSVGLLNVAGSGSSLQGMLLIP